VFTIRRSLVATAATVALAGFAALGVAAPANAATVNGVTKIGICKATGSATNPYTFVYKTPDSIASGNYSANDIVPVFDFVDASGNTMHFLGNNTVSTSVTTDCQVVVPVATYM
jgi:hypothetical protein